MPTPDRALGQPLPQLHPHGIVAVLMTGHHDAPGRARRARNAIGLARRERDGLLAEHVVALLERPNREIEVRRRRRANVDEVHIANGAQCIAVRELRNSRQWFDAGRTIHGGHDLETIARGRVVHEAGNVRATRDAAEPDHRTAIFPRTRRCSDRVQTRRRGRRRGVAHRASESAVSRRTSSVIESASIASSSVITSGGLMRTSGL